MATAATTSLKLDPSTKERLQKLAESRQRKPHWLMKEAIEQYVEREEKRQSFRDDAEKAWKDYRATGLHLTAEETDRWLEKLAGGDDAEPPACHD
jgi:predicted transcriptional regulator